MTNVYTIEARPDVACLLKFKADHTGTMLPLPIMADDAHKLIYAAFKAPEGDTRREYLGVIADKTDSGVTVHVVAQPHSFHFPWAALACGVEVVK